MCITILCTPSFNSLVVLCKQTSINFSSSFYVFLGQIYIINLKRRMDRRTRMIHTLDILEMEATLTDAVDGKYEIKK